MVRLHLLSGSAFLELLHPSHPQTTCDVRPHPTLSTYHPRVSPLSTLPPAPDPDTMFKVTSVRAMQPTRMMFMRQTAPMYMRQTARMMKPVPVS